MPKKKLDSWEHALILERRTEAKYLMTKYSYEEIGRAFCHEAGEIRAVDDDDSAQAAFAHGVAFRCFLNKLSSVKMPVDEEFKGILHELSASDMDCDVVQVEPFGGTATIHG